MMDDAPTVFVIPPSSSLECSIHKGLLVDPVDTTCGCTYCRSCIEAFISEHPRCPTHESLLTRDMLRNNEQAQGFINDLLIYCKGGLQQTTTGSWVVDPAGCQMWLNLAKRQEHENVCVHVKNLHSGAEIRPPVHTCIYKDAGCVFTSTTPQEMIVHTERCGYGTLLKRIEQLEYIITEKDTEIKRLRTQTESHESTSNVREILDTISRGLDKLDEDSTRLFEDAKDTLRKTRTNIKNSSAYQTSLQVLHSIREVVESARLEFISKVVEIEKVAKAKVKAITQDKKNITPSSSSTSPSDSTPLAIEPQTDTNNNNCTVEDQSECENVQQPVSESVGAVSVIDNVEDEPSSVEEVDEQERDVSDSEESDEDIKEFLLVSKHLYEQEQEDRKAEEEAVRQAVRLSLLDQANKQH